MIIMRYHNTRTFIASLAFTVTVKPLLIQYLDNPEYLLVPQLYS